MYLEHVQKTNSFSFLPGFPSHPYCPNQGIVTLFTWNPQSFPGSFAVPSWAFCHKVLQILPPDITLTHFLPNSWFHLISLVDKWVTLLISLLASSFDLLKSTLYTVPRMIRWCKFNHVTKLFRDRPHRHQGKTEASQNDMTGLHLGQHSQGLHPMFYR